MPTVGEIFGVIKLKGGPQFVRDFKGVTQRIRAEVANVRTALQGAFAAIAIKEFNQAANDLINSQRKLAATARLTDSNLQNLQSTAQQAKEQFSLTTKQSIDFTIALTKLTKKAGQVEKTGDAIARLLDLAAAQGLGAEEALTAINQAILGIDEGTDKLFQKNPSAIYEEYAKQIGTTAGKLTDQQKAQALLNQVLFDGLKVQGEYQKFLKDAPGQQAQFNATLEETKALFGLILQTFTPVLSSATDFLQFLNNADQSTRNFIAAIVAALVQLRLLRVALVALNVSLGPTGWLIAGVTAAAAAFGFFQSRIRTTKDELAEFRQEIAGFTQEQLEAERAKLQEIVNELKGVKEEREKALLQKGVNPFEAEKQASLEAFKLVNDTIITFSDAIQRIEAINQKLTEMQQKRAQESANIKAELAKREQEILEKGANMEVKLRTSALEKATKKRLDLNRFQLEAQKKFDQEAIDQAREAAANLSRVNAEIERRLQTFVDNISSAVGNISSAFGRDLIAGAKKFKETFKAILIEMVEFIEREFVLAKIHTIIKGIISGGTTLAKDLPLLAIALGLLEGAKASIRALATGGLITQPTLAMIGEAGPEVVAPLDDFKAFAVRLIEEVQRNRPAMVEGGDVIVNQHFVGPLHDRRMARKATDEVLAPELRRRFKKKGRFINQDPLA